MNRLLEPTAKLTPSEVKKVEDFAQSLVQRFHGNEKRGDDQKQQKHIHFSSLVECMSHIEPEKSDKQLVREAWDEPLSKYD